MTTLYLTVAERRLWDRLPPVLREGWDVEEETGQFRDSPEKKIVRLGLVRLHDSKLLRLRDACMQAPTVEAVVALVQDMDLEGVHDDDMADLFFALGPDVIGGLISYGLSTAETDKDIEGVTALTVVRNAILRSYQPA